MKSKFSCVNKTCERCKNKVADLYMVCFDESGMGVCLKCKKDYENLIENYILNKN